MTYYPQSTSGLNYTTGPAGPTAAASTISAAGTGNTKGSYTQLISSLGFNSNFITIAITRGTANNAELFLVDIATGAAGSESVKIPNISYGRSDNTTSHDGAKVTLPFAITSGTRVAARCQSNIASAQCFGSVTAYAAGTTPGPSSYTTGGVSTGTSAGTIVDPGGSTNTKGSYAQLISSTSLVIQILFLHMTNGTTASPAAAQWAVDFATGAAGAEVVLIADLRNGTPGLANVPKISIRWWEFLTYIASSTRLSCRASCDIATATVREITIGVSGATGPAETSGGMRSYVG